MTAAGFSSTLGSRLKTSLRTPWTNAQQVDPYAAYVVCLMDMAGRNGGTKILDYAGRTWTANGIAGLSNATKLFGPTSLSTPDTAGARISADSYLSDFAVGTGDFCVEAIVYTGAPPGGGVSNDKLVFGSFNFSSPFVLFLTNGGNFLAFWNGTVGIYSSTNAVATNTWTHVCAERESGTLRLYVNGVQAASGSMTSNYTSVTDCQIGGATDNSRQLRGFVQAVRFTKCARYRGNFAAQLLAFPR